MRARIWFQSISAGVRVATVVVPGLVAAQEPPDTTDQDTVARRMERVVVTAGRTPALVGAASAVIVIPEGLRTPTAPLLDEALRATPFVLVRQNSRGETELSVRGSGSRQMAVMIDGVPLSLGWDHRSDPSLVPLTGVQTVLLVRGPSALLYGPNVLGGVIDLGMGRSGAGSDPRSRVWAGAGIDPYGGRAFTIGGQVPICPRRRGCVSMRAGGSYRQRDGFRVTANANDTTAEDGLRTNSDLRHVDGFTSVRWQNATGRHLGVTATAYAAERGVPPELHLQTPRLWRYPDQSRALVALSSGTGAVATPFGTGSLEISGGYNAGKLAIESFRDRGYTTLDARELGAERIATARIRLSHSIVGGMIRTAFTGSEVRYEETVGFATPSNYRQRMWSSGAEVQWPLGARIAVVAGAAHDAATTPEGGGKERLGRVDAWGWRGGTTVLVNHGLNVHASVSRRSRFPALRELYSGALNRFQPNPNLKAERLTSAELGTTMGSDGATPRGVSRGRTLQLVAFHHKLKDAVVQTTVPNTQLFIRVNRDEIRSTGAELMGVWHSSSESTEAFSVSGDLLAQRVRVRDHAAQVETRPEHQPQLRGSFELGVPLLLAIRGYASAHHTGAQYCLRSGGGDQLKLDGKTKGSLSLERSWPLGRSEGLYEALRTTLTLENMTDVTVFDQCGLPQPGRTLRLTIQLL